MCGSSPVQLKLTGPTSVTAALIVLGVSNSTWLGVNLPFDLGLIGMPGCRLFASLEMLVPVQFVGGQASLSGVVPNVPPLVGSRFFAQGLLADATANAPGLIVSNGVAGKVGAR